MADEKSKDLDITQVIDKSTSDVAVSDLAKKGFKQVKVLKRRVILELISEAVDRVIADHNQVSADEREKIIRESKDRFEQTAREKLETERDLEKMRGENIALSAKVEALQNEIATLRSGARGGAELRSEVEKLRGRLAERESQISEMQKSGSAMNQQFMLALLTKISEKSAQSKSEEMSALQSSIEGLADRISRMGSVGGGGAGGAAFFDAKDVDFEKLFRSAGAAELESNVGDVKVKESKAGGVKSTLAKLKALQQGGAKDGE